MVNNADKFCMLWKAPHPLVQIVVCKLLSFSQTIQRPKGYCPVTAIIWERSVVLQEKISSSFVSLRTYHNQWMTHAM
jgi:hypothetical protein